jgi:hypothetical protein
MNDFECVAYQNDHYCVSCCPVSISTPGVQPVFENAVVEEWPRCVECSTRHVYMQKRADAGSRWRIIEQTSPSGKTLFRCRCCGRIDISPQMRCLSSPACETWTRPQLVASLLTQFHEAIVEMSPKERVALLTGVTEFCCIHCGEPTVDRHGHPPSCSCLKVQQVVE